MIDFDEEIEKFKPSLEISEAEDVIYKYDNIKFLFLRDIQLLCLCEEIANESA